MSYTPPPPPPEPGGNGEIPQDGPGATPPGYGAPPPPPPGYGGPGYGGPGYGGPPEGPPQNSSRAVASLVVGIMSPILGLCCAIFGLVGIVAIVLGRSAQKEIAAGGGRLTGDGMAKAGIILGIIGSVLGVLMTILNVVLLLLGDSTVDFNTVG